MSRGGVSYPGISDSLQGVEVMQQLLLYRQIGGHTEGELSLRSNEAARALDDPAPKRVRRSKAQKAGRFSSVAREGGYAIICSSRPRLWAISMDAK
jgi:hypothetical protein